MGRPTGVACETYVRYLKKKMSLNLIFKIIKSSYIQKQATFMKGEGSESENCSLQNIPSRKWTFSSTEG